MIWFFNGQFKILLIFKQNQKVSVTLTFLLQNVFFSLKCFREHEKNIRTPLCHYTRPKPHSTPPDVISHNSPMMNFPTVSLLARSDWWMWKIAWFSRFSFDFEQIQFRRFSVLNKFVVCCWKQRQKMMLMKFPNQWKFVQACITSRKPLSPDFWLVIRRFLWRNQIRQIRSSMSTPMTFEISSSLTQAVYWWTFGSLITSPEHPRSRFPTIKNLWAWRLEVS